jgi:hypothetical protein
MPRPPSGQVPLTPSHEGKMSRTRVRLIGLVGLAMAFGACDQTPVSLPEATSIVANPARLELIAGDLSAISAQVLDQRGHPLRGARAAWSSDAAGVARVDSNGMVTAVAPGSATLSASYGNLTAQVPITVARDERDLIASIEIRADTVAIDRGIGSRPVSFRAYDGRGRYRCDANFDLLSSDRSVATATYLGGCQLEILPVGPGLAVFTVSANGVGDSFVVRVTSHGQIAFISDSPQPEEFFAGNTVTYRVRLLDADDRPITGHTVNFEVNLGQLPLSSMGTDDQGYASVQWRLPRILRYSGSFEATDGGMMVFRTQLPNGRVEEGWEYPIIRPAPAATIHFFTNIYRTAAWQFSAVSESALAPTGTWVQILAEARDQYGNRRSPWDIQMTRDSQPVYSEIIWVVGGGRYFRGFSTWEPVAGSSRVTATEGTGSGSLEVIFRDGQ